MFTPHRWIVSVLLVVGLLGIPSTAAADITAFLGVNPTPTNRAARGLAIGTGLVIVAFEFEYAHSNEDISEGSPALRTFMRYRVLEAKGSHYKIEYQENGGGTLTTASTIEFEIEKRHIRRNGSPMTIRVLRVSSYTQK